MGASGWRSRRSVIERLALEAHRFDFHQAVRLIEQMRPEAQSVGDCVQAEREAVRFRSSLAAGFPASDLGGARPPRPGQPHWEVQVNFMGLAGGFGPLPAPFSEAIQRQSRAGDTAARDYLDIFNHRLVSLFFRARKRHRPVLTRQSPDLGPFANYLYALIGLGTAGLQARMAVPDRALLKHAGQIAGQPHSQHGLEKLLESYFAVPVRVLPLQGRWLTIDSSQVTRLGRANSCLGSGDSAVLGTRVWDQQASIRVELGPLDYQSFRNFLPDGRSWAALRSLLDNYLENSVIIDIGLVLLASSVPSTTLSGSNCISLQSTRKERLGSRHDGDRLGAGARLVTRPGATAPRLGWTSWLTTRPRTDDGLVTISGRIP
ncbi:MAG: type VI secretion system baseplate subunit TssG [Rhodospirillaceae bacterium]